MEVRNAMGELWMAAQACRKIFITKYQTMESIRSERTFPNSLPKAQCIQRAYIVQFLNQKLPTFFNLETDLVILKRS